MAQFPPPQGKYSITLHLCDQVNAYAFSIHPTREVITPVTVLSIPEIGQHIHLSLRYLEQAKHINFDDMSPSTFMLVTAYHDLLVSLLNYFRRYFPLPGTRV
jgi:hypothetical protein